MSPSATPLRPLTSTSPPPRSTVRGLVARGAFGLLALVGVTLAAALVVYPPEYVYRVLVWQGSDAFDWQKFPSTPLAPAPTTHLLPVATDPTVASLLGELAGTNDWEAFLADHDTQAFIVVRNGAVAYERYFNGTQRDSIVTSFSIAKSIDSALVGIAIAGGAIASVDDPITRYLPELALRDTRFSEIRIRDLLLMSSGLEYQAVRPFLLNGDDPLTTYYPDQDQPHQHARSGAAGAASCLQQVPPAVAGYGPGAHDGHARRAVPADKALGSARHGIRWLVEHR